MSRWVRIHAGIFDHHLFQGHAMSEREAWLWLIVNAAWKDTKHRIGASIVDVPMGSLFVTLRQLQAHWGWKSDYRVRAFLRVLENERMITTKTNAGKTQVSVCNYSKYQAAFREDNAEKTHGQRTENAIKTPIHQYTIEDTPYVVSSQCGDDGETEKPKTDYRMDLFEEFWRIYPHRNGAKKGKKPCIEKWRAAVKSGVDPALIVDRARLYRTDASVLRKFGRMPQVWLNQHGWEDDIEQEALPNRHPPPKQETEFARRQRTAIEDVNRALGIDDTPTTDCFAYAFDLEATDWRTE